MRDALSKVEEVRKDVTRLRRLLEKQSLSTWGEPECHEPAKQGHPYAFSELGDISVGRLQSMHLLSMPAPEDDTVTPSPSPLPPSLPFVAVSAQHAGGIFVPSKPAEFGGKVAWDAYHAQFKLLTQEQGWSAHEKSLPCNLWPLCGPAL